jgi:hypothetical protein
MLADAVTVPRRPAVADTPQTGRDAPDDELEAQASFRPGRSGRVATVDEMEPMR